MGTETSKIALNAHVHLRTANRQMSRPERHVDDITDMRRSCRLRENTSGRRPLGSSSRLLKVPNNKKKNTAMIFHLLNLSPTAQIRGTQRQFSENICSEDDLRSRIFGTFVVKFFASLPLLGFSNI